MQSLPTAQRDVLVARYWQGLEPHEIAARNQEEPAAVRQRLRRATENVRARIGRRQDECAAWLAPFLVGMPTGVKLGVGATVLLGGMMMKQVVAVVAVLLLLTLGLLTYGPWQVGAASPSPPTQPPNLAK